MFITYFSDDGPQKPSTSMYKLGQALPPQHWYQKRVGWFGRTMAASLVIGLAGFFVSANMIAHNDKKALAAETTQSAKVAKEQSKISANPALENIIDLQPILDNWSNEHKGQKWAVVAKSITGPSFDAELNPTKEFESASIYKLFLMQPLFQQIPVEQQGKINIDISTGQKSISTCVDLMIRLSNNECGEAVGKYVNWNKAGSTLKKSGFSHTKFTQDGIKTSAGDTAKFLEQLNGDMLTRTGKEAVMKSLYQQRWRDGIPAGCPGCIVANKTGQINGVTHDAALVQYKGGTYVLTVFSEGGSFKQIAQLTGQIQQKILDSTSRK